MDKKTKRNASIKLLVYLALLFFDPGIDAKSVPRTQFGNGGGSAFVIGSTESHTYYATAKHCVRNDSTTRFVTTYFRSGTITTTDGTERDGTNTKCQVVWKSKTRDVAILRTERTGAKALEISNRIPSSTDPCVFIGWPSGYCLATVKGKIIKPGRITASPIGGFSGGPLLVNGKVVGVIVARRDDGVGIYEPIKPVADWLQRNGIK